MENWGLVTYRETCLLVDPLHSSTFSRQIVAIVVSHELAHQWFGNLVTMVKQPNDPTNPITHEPYPSIFEKEEPFPQFHG